MEEEENVKFSQTFFANKYLKMFSIFWSELWWLITLVRMFLKCNANAESHLIQNI